MSLETILPVFHIIRDFGRKHINPSEWYSPFYIKTPFDNSTPFGWTILYAFKLSLIYCAVIILVANTLMHICPAIYIETFCDDFSQIFHKIDNMVRQGNTKHKQKVEKALIEAINFYMEIMR